jgi:hypothetical protein
MTNMFVGFYVAALGAALIAWMAGPLYGVLPPSVWLTLLSVQVAIGGALFVHPWR